VGTLALLSLCCRLQHVRQCGGKEQGEHPDPQCSKSFYYCVFSDKVSLSLAGLSSQSSFLSLLSTGIRHAPPHQAQNPKCLSTSMAQVDYTPDFMEQVTVKTVTTACVPHTCNLSTQEAKGLQD
jgi:hypothetical protein